ncbi:MAG: glycosyltransferase [Acidimicrobiia bacterium]
MVVPVFDEATVLAANVRRLHAYLDAHCPYSWRITIADNASTDGTLAIARELARQLAGVEVRHLDRKGRGLALRDAWNASDGRVVAYMDVDLSTDLDAFVPLVAPLVSGHSDIATGSRLAPGASVARGPKREAISRIYNLLLRAMFATRVRDMQCGFKAVRTDVARALLPAVEDDGWFFDTELLLLAERNGLRIHQVPVDWTDDPDSRVNVTQTALADLRGVCRLGAAFVRGRGRVAVPHVRREVADDFGRRFVSFGVIGVVSTVATIALFLALRDPVGAVAANLLALSVVFVANSWLNALSSYRADRPRWRAVGAIFLGTAVASTGALLAVGAAGGGALAEVAALVVVWAAAGALRLRHLDAVLRKGDAA